MEISSEQLLDLAKLEFLSIPDVDPPAVGDRFFQKYGVGNRPMVDRPYERFIANEKLLESLRGADKQKYNDIHKGTPFYFLGWTAFDLRNYEKAVFYMDAALSEDIRQTVRTLRMQGQDPERSDDQLAAASYEVWRKNPAGLFMTLDVSNPNQAAWHIVCRVRESIRKTLESFRSAYPEDAFYIQEFLDRFVGSLLRQKAATRSLVTAAYSFVLESDDLESMLRLRGHSRGSAEPFLLHLFKGAVICESLLKDAYCADPNDPRPKTLGQIYKSAEFQRDFGKIEDQPPGHGFHDICRNAKARSVPIAMKTAKDVRNATAHNLVFDEAFDNDESYGLLRERLWDAVLLVAKRKFCGKSTG